MMQSPLFRRMTLFSALVVAAAGAVIAQELSLEELVPALKEQAVKVAIIARVVEQNQEEVWNSVNSKVTIPGRPVGMKLVGNNIVVAIQFTLYRQRNGSNILVAQGQIWIDIPNQGIHYQTTMETIPLEYGEQIYFFPLGSGKKPGEPRIEIQVEINPYTDEQPPPQVPASEVPSPQVPPPESQSSVNPKSPGAPVRETAGPQ
ncbi:MAG: hypothetical protein LBP81_04615 [Treponema sp.]|jgi:hypothetical protein|nr:hypothetical protein [Treponema sp.]